LSFSVDRETSYLGVTSIKAAFLVMLKVTPALFLGVSNHPIPRLGSSMKPTLFPSSEGKTLIDVYFNRVQILVPLLDEPSFRASGRRNDSPWLALLNMVFSMGSIVADKSITILNITLGLILLAVSN
jgi:hypothetical protein